MLFRSLSSFSAKPSSIRPLARTPQPNPNAPVPLGSVLEEYDAVVAAAAGAASDRKDDAKGDFQADSTDSADPDTDVDVDSITNSAAPRFHDERDQPAAVGRALDQAPAAPPMRRVEVNRSRKEK